MKSVRSPQPIVKSHWVLALALVIAGAFVTTFLSAQTHGDTQEGSEPAVHEPAAPAHEPTEHAKPAAHGAAADHAAPAEHGSEHGEATHAEGHGGHHGPEAINWSDLSDKQRPAFVALIINFGLLAALYYTLGKKPVAEGLKQRRISIAKAIEEAKKMLDEANARAKKHRGNLDNVDTEAATAKAAIITAGKGEVERLLTETEERAERMKRDAERLVEQERKQLHQDLVLETIDLSVAQAQKILERSATPEDHARLAQELLMELSRKPAAPRVAPKVGGVA
jgi:F-type H+-transporting ATPase subunit b